MAQKNLASTLTRAERLALVDRHDATLLLKEQADLLTMCRHSLYDQSMPPSAEKIAIKHTIDRIYTDQPAYGSRQIAVVLERDDGLLVNRKAMQRHMREMGIAGINPGPNRFSAQSGASDLSLPIAGRYGGVSKACLVH